MRFRVTFSLSFGVQSHFSYSFRHSMYHLSLVWRPEPLYISLQAPWVITFSCFDLWSHFSSALSFRVHIHVHRHCTSYLHGFVFVLGFSSHGHLVLITYSLCSSSFPLPLPSVRLGHPPIVSSLMRFLVQHFRVSFLAWLPEPSFFLV